MAIANGGLLPIASASCRTAASSCSGGATRFSNPCCKAVGASMKSPVSSNSKACLRLRLRLSATPGVEQNSPTLIPDVAKRAFSAATARSQAATS